MQVDELVRLPRLSRVAVCGGTHGNELSGVYLVREMLKPENRKEDGGPASVLMLLSNPRAVQQCTRYVDTDLNRCFTHATLNGPASEGSPYEIFRARELNNLLGPKGSRAAVDLICDLHNTTANMGLCFIAYSDCDWVCLHIFRHLQKQMPDTSMRFIHFDVSTKESYSLDSIGKHGFAMEIGPQPHGCINSNVYTAMREGVQHMRDWVSCFNSGESNVSMAQLPVCRGG
ncbi:PREDICTED: N-acyl-aromatic-L-amino acid amidohydrolase (carboxylate-forming) B-like [Poecilia mexicana]|uniref:N-acyl-aromatic-L-amino acid amidohydrolase (carboxylate-forming) B-like n=1 Tax=Poecilia mexicana TaxID=48701 RepID=UPI00072DB473|nr:PREDICTED: N-acyl-aromatic-L-amino acid amidohydrolase (carboxylate-forming) B-like [Poecilia mexicana]